MPISCVEYSWAWALNEAYARGRVFGSEFVFTFGPLGFLYTKIFHPETALRLWLYGSAFVLVYTLLLWRYVTRTIRARSSSSRRSHLTYDAGALGK